MAWGIEFKHTVFIKNASIGCKADLEDAIEECLEDIEIAKMALIGFYCVTPYQDPEEPGKFAEDALKCVSEKIERITEAQKMLTLLLLLKDFLEDNPDVDLLYLNI